MKTYNSEESKSIHLLKQQKYIDKEFNLKDGQYRLKLAKMAGIKFIDVWVE